MAILIIDALSFHELKPRVTISVVPMALEELLDDCG